MKGTVNEEVGMQKEHRCVHRLPFSFLLPFTVQMCLPMLKVRAGEAVEKEQLWVVPALAAQLLAVPKGPHCPEQRGVGGPDPCLVGFHLCTKPAPAQPVSAPNNLAGNIG